MQEAVRSSCCLIITHQVWEGGWIMNGTSGGLTTTRCCRWRATKWRVRTDAVSCWVTARWDSAKFRLKTQETTPWRCLIKMGRDWPGWTSSWRCRVSLQLKTDTNRQYQPTTDNINPQTNRYQPLHHQSELQLLQWCFEFSWKSFYFKVKLMFCVCSC